MNSEANKCLLLPPLHLPKLEAKLASCILAGLEIELHNASEHMYYELESSPAQPAQVAANDRCERASNLTHKVSDLVLVFRVECLHDRFCFELLGTELHLSQ